MQALMHMFPVLDLLLFWYMMNIVNDNEDNNNCVR